MKNTKNHEKIIENIDVGGPTMVRSAAKNYKDVTVITSSDQYDEFIEELRSKYLDICSEKKFQSEFNELLKQYVGRPTPLYFAERLSKKYNTKIYLKREDLCHTGAHKINNTIGQILLAKRLGKSRIIAETGAGQHGVATATVCALMGIKCIVYMGEVDISRHKKHKLCYCLCRWRK